MKRPASKVAERVYEALTEKTLDHHNTKQRPVWRYDERDRKRILAAIERAIGAPGRTKAYRLVIGRRIEGGHYIVTLHRLPEIEPGTELILSARVTGTVRTPEEKVRSRQIRRPLADAAPAKGRRGRRA